MSGLDEDPLRGHPRFETLALLGTGSYGTVIKAKKKQPNARGERTEVAIKLLARGECVPPKRHSHQLFTGNCYHYVRRWHHFLTSQGVIATRRSRAYPAFKGEPCATPSKSSCRETVCPLFVLIRSRCVQFWHPHVVRLNDIFLTPHHLAVVLELVPGGDLFSYVKRQRGCREPQVLINTSLCPIDLLYLFI